MSCLHRLSFLLAWFALREPVVHLASEKVAPFFAGFRDIDRPTRRLIAVGFLFTLARFSEGFLVLKAIETGLSIAWSPLALVVFNLGFGALAYQAGGWSDRVRPRSVLAASREVAAAVLAQLVRAHILRSPRVQARGARAS